MAEEDDDDDEDEEVVVVVVVVGEEELFFLQKPEFSLHSMCFLYRMCSLYHTLYINQSSQKQYHF